MSKNLTGLATIKILCGFGITRKQSVGSQSTGALSLLNDRINYLKSNKLITAKTTIKEGK